MTTTPIAQELIVRSRERVKAHGEVFTPRHMVDRMLDLVREDLEDGPGFVDKTFLEPAAGGGNFLAAILHRKLKAIECRLPADIWQHESLFALASVYGIELLEDNHQDAKAVMLAEFLRFHESHGTPCGRRTNLHKAAVHLIEANIVRGNTLTGLDWLGADMQLSWWTRVEGAPGMVQREPFTLQSLRAGEQLTLLDLTVYESYAPSRIDRVHQEATAHV